MIKTNAHTLRFTLEDGVSTDSGVIVANHETFSGGCETLSILARDYGVKGCLLTPDTLAVLCGTRTLIYRVVQDASGEVTPEPETVQVFPIDALSEDARNRALSANWETLHDALPRQERLSAEVPRQCSTGIPLDRAVTESYAIVLDRLVDLANANGMRFTANGTRL